MKKVPTSNPSESGLRSIPRLLGENASCGRLFIGDRVRSLRKPPRTGSVLSEIISCGSRVAAEGLNVDDANQPLASSSSESSSSEEDPKSSGNLNAYGRNETMRGSQRRQEGNKKPNANPRRPSLGTTRTRTSLITRSGIEMGANFPPLCRALPELLLTLRDPTCYFLHRSHCVQPARTWTKRSPGSGGGNVLFIDLPTRTSGSSQREGRFPSPKETRVLVFSFLVPAGNIVIPFGLGCKLHDDEAEVGRGVIQSSEDVLRDKC
jgi:hypothetical protein